MPAQPRTGVFLFLGSDRPKKLQRIQELERHLGVQPLDRHALDAATLSGAALLAFCRQQPAESPCRLIVVDQAHRLDRAAVEGLLEHAEAIASVASVVLLVEPELSLRHPLAQAAERFTVERFPGRDQPAVKPFAFTDALGRRHLAEALSAARDQVVAGKEPLELLGLMGWQLNRWVVVRRLLDGGTRPDAIAAMINMKPWQVERIQAEASGRSLGRLQALLARCWELDVDAKSGRVAPELALEQLVVEVCSGGVGETGLLTSRNG